MKVFAAVFLCILIAYEAKAQCECLPLKNSQNRGKYAQVRGSQVHF